MGTQTNTRPTLSDQPKRLFALGNMAERTGLEPATPGVTGRYSNQLNYRSGTGLVGVTGVEPVTFGL